MPGPEGASGRAGAKTPDEQREAVDRDLDTSLAEFDAMLLKEQQEVAARRAEHGGGAGAGGEGEGGEGGGGEGTGSGGSGARSGRSTAGGPGATGSTEARGGDAQRTGRGKDQTTGSSRGGDREGGGREVTTAPEGGGAVQDDPSRVPADVGDGRDDDVVARQLREAATSEEDPNIREKLWEEYRRYKRGGS